MPYIEIIQMNKINSWDEFQPLQEVMLGSLYYSDFFNDVKNPKIKSALKKIIDETHEDLNFFKETMSSHNIKVYQADIKEMDYKDSILDYVNVNGELGYKKNVGDDFFYTGVSASLIPNPPLQPRDDSIVMGNRILCTDPKTFATSRLVPFLKKWFGYENIDTSVADDNLLFTRSNKNLEIFLRKENKQATKENLDVARQKNKLGGFCSPTLTRIGKTCLVDTWQTPSVVEEFLELSYPEFNYRKITIGGHNDAIFSVIKPGLVIATQELKPYEKIFDNWNIIWFDDPNWKNVRHFRHLRSRNQGKWWVPGEETNDEFTYFVEGFLNNWVGQADETIFDVNCLVIDDKHVVVNSDNPYLIENLKKYNMTAIVCPLRHSFFWDGGWHCLTLDVKRNGKQTNYGI